MSNEPITNNEIIFYTSPEGTKKIEVCYQDENFWLTQKAMAELFGVQRPAITKHLKNIIDTGELLEDSVSSILEHTADDGKVYATKYYNLDAIIAVGYRVNSYQALRAEQEYDVYRKIQDEIYVSDFDKEIQRIEGKK